MHSSRKRPYYASNSRDQARSSLDNRLDDLMKDQIKAEPKEEPENLKNSPPSPPPVRKNIDIQDKWLKVLHRLVKNVYEKPFCFPSTSNDNPKPAVPKKHVPLRGVPKTT